VDEYKPINVHGILLTAVHDAVQVKNSTFQMNDESLLLPTKHSNCMTLKIIVSSGRLATTGHNKKCDPD